MVLTVRVHVLRLLLLNSLSGHVNRPFDLGSNFLSELFKFFGSLCLLSLALGFLFFFFHNIGQRMMSRFIVFCNFTSYAT